MASTRKGRGPGRPPRSEAEHEDSRERLIDAAAKVFAARGYEGATVDAVLDEAELSKGTFYWNFDSKDGLFLALVEERIERPVRVLMDMTRSAPAEAAMAPVVSASLAELGRDQRDILLLVHEYWSRALRDEALKDRYREREAGLRDALTRVLDARHEASGLEPSMPPSDLAIAYMALARGLALEALMDPDLVPDGLFGEVMSLVWDGFVLRAQRREEERREQA